MKLTYYYLDEVDVTRQFEGANVTKPEAELVLADVGQKVAQGGLFVFWRDDGEAFAVPATRLLMVRFE